jgi:DNA excision repair protein ERCC-1
MVNPCSYQVTLLTTFGSLRGIAQASADDLRMCPGFGESKAAKLRAVFDQPFDTRGSKADAARTPRKGASAASAAAE